MTGDAPELVLDDDGNVRILTLNRPEKLNALNRSLIEHLTAELGSAEAAEDVRAVVLAGCPTAFSAGVDLDDTSALSSSDEIRAHADRVAGLFSRISNMTTPVVAAIEGYALGGGCGIAMAADIVVAAEDAVFGYPEATRGVMPALVAPNLVKRAGAKTAFALLALGQRQSAATFKELGLVFEITAPGAARAEALRIAGLLAGHDSRIIAWIKSLTIDCESLSLDVGFARARDVNALAREALKAGGK